MFIVLLIPFFGKGTILDEGYSIENLPSPKLRGQDFYVSNPDNILSSSTVVRIDELLANLEKESQAEFGIVVVNNYQGDSDFEFALSLFNSWGIGKSESNNGLLLFIAKDRHEYRFISGYGMESIFPDAYLKRIGEQYLVPNFQRNDYDLGVLEATRFIVHVLKSPDSIKELNRLMPEVGPFWSINNPILFNAALILVLLVLLYKYVDFVSTKVIKVSTKKDKTWIPVFQGCGCMIMLIFVTAFIFAFIFDNIKEVYQVKNIPYFILVLCSIILSIKILKDRNLIKERLLDSGERDAAYRTYMKWLFIPMIINPLSWIDLFLISKTLFKNIGRYTPPDGNGEWERIVRSVKKNDKGLLSQGERNEERIKSRRYEIWRNKKNNKITTIPWEINKKYHLCPKCSFFTLELSATKEIRAATYSSTGEGLEFDKCHNCSYKKDKGKFTIPKKQRSSEGGSSGGGSSGGGRSSSSSGSFGGGSSGGGGAGGRW